MYKNHHYCVAVRETTAACPGKTRTGCKGVLWLKGKLIAIQGGDYLQYLATCARVTSAALAMFSSFDSL